MLKNLNTVQKVFFWILFGLSVVSLFVSIFVIYVMATQRKPETLGVTYAATLDSSSGNVPICEVEIWSNDNKNGQQMYEIQWNSYTDTQGNGVKGFGLQILGNYSLYDNGTITSRQILDNYNKITVLNDSYFIGSSYFYYTDDLGLSSYACPIEEIEDCLYIDIDDTFYKMNLITNTVQRKKTDIWSTIKSWFGSYSYEDVNYQYSWYSISDYIIKSALLDSARANNEIFYINYLDCAEYYELLQYDGRQYKEMPEVSHLKNYLQVKVTYHKDGAQEYTDSLFHQVANSVTWSYDDGTNAKDFWDSEDTFTITEDMISLLKLEGVDAYYITIDSAFVDLLKTQTNTNYIIDINLDNISKNVIGVELSNFTLEVESFTISSSTDMQFTVLNATNIIPTLEGGLYV